MLSINLAQKTNDPVRMADSVERLLSLGWPGQDEYIPHRGAQPGRNTRQDPPRSMTARKEADTLLAKLTASEARDVFVRLSWDGDADFDLAVARAPGRHRQLRHSAHRLWRLDHQERLRLAPRGSLCLPARLRRRIHDQGHDHLHESQQTGDPADAGNDHARGDQPGEEGDLRPRPGQAQQSCRREADRRPAQTGAALRRPAGSDVVKRRRRQEEPARAGSSR